MPQLSEHLLWVEPVLAWDVVSMYGVGLFTNENDLNKFYDNLHSPLEEAGIDGLKVDVQSGLASLGGGLGGSSHIARLYTRALERSAERQFAFGNNATGLIRCMSHSTDNVLMY